MGKSRYGYFGRPVKFLGDVDGDGLADVLAGAVCDERSPDVNSEGIVRCLSGADGHLLYSVAGGAQNLRLGGELVALDDLNGDGRADFAASTRDGIDVRSGRDGALLRRLRPCDPKPSTFWNMEACPDMDGDGHRDVLVAIGDEFTICGTGHEEYAGKLLVLSTRNGSMIRSIDGSDDQDQRFGLRGTVLDDLDGDHVPELAIDLPWDGTCQVFSGTTGKLRQTISEAGRAVTGPMLDVGDVDGDGLRDHVVAARSTDDGGRADWAGLELLSGNDANRLAQRAIDEDLVFSAPPVVLVPDIDGDGIGELAVGESRHESYRGRVLFLSGKSLQTLGSIVGPQASSIFACSLDAVGELGDGRGPALVVGAIGDSRGMDDGGSVTLLRLHPR